MFPCSWSVQGRTGNLAPPGQPPVRHELLLTFFAVPHQQLEAATAEIGVARTHRRFERARQRRGHAVVVAVGEGRRARRWRSRNAADRAGISSLTCTQTPPPRRARLVAWVIVTAIRHRLRARWILVYRGRSADGDGVALRRARLGLAAAGLGLLLGGAVAPFAGAQETLDELREEREEVQEEQRETGEDLDALTLDLDAAEAELRRLDGLATDARAAAVQARTDADDAAAEAARSSSSADLADSELGHLERRAAFFAVELYTGNAEARSLEGILRGDLFADATIDVVMGTVIGDSTSFAAQVDVALDELTKRRDAASSATTRAQVLSDEALRALVVADEAEAEYLSFVIALQDRLDHTLAEAEALKELDADLAERIRAREAYLASLLPPRAPGRGNVGPPVGIDQTTVVRGFRVNVEIAEQVDGLLAAAAEAGLNLGGGGWRDGASQVALRRAHCGPTEFDIYVRPANECRPPTARPTASMHERGLALDLSNDGALITSRSNRAYLWLIENAADYGFFNLPSEPWHWSVNGR